MDYEDYLEELLWAADRNPDELISGENISCIPQLKIVFDCYGYDEENDEEFGDTSTECYKFYIHKDSLSEGFVYPEQADTCLDTITSENEVCINVVFDADNETWSIQDLESAHAGSTLTIEKSFEIIKTLYERELN